MITFNFGSYTGIFTATLIWLSLILSGLLSAVWFSTFHPKASQTEQVHCRANAPLLQTGQTIKLYNQNIQFMAGKNYVFFYDLPNNKGPDERPSSTDIQATLQGLANLIQQQVQNVAVTVINSDNFSLY